MDAEKIAKGLTKAQREALGFHAPTYGDRTHGWPDPAYRDTSFAKAGRKLMAIGLIAWCGNRASDTRLTPLGLAVRDVIAREGRR